MQVAHSQRSTPILMIPVSVTLDRLVVGRIQSKQGSMHVLGYLFTGVAQPEKLKPRLATWGPAAASGPGHRLPRAVCAPSQGPAGRGSQTGKGLWFQANSSWPVHCEGPGHWQTKVKWGLYSKAGGDPPVLWRGGSFCDSPYMLAVSRESQKGTWKGSPRPRPCRVGSASLSCLRLPRGHARGCEDLLASLMGLAGLWVPTQRRGLGSQVWPQEAIVAVSRAMLNSYNSPPLSRPQRIRCKWLSLYVIFGTLQFLFILLTDSCYLFFTLEWFLFSCLDPDLHKKYEHSYFNLITIAKYLPKCLFLFGQTNRSKCICLQPGKLCFAHLTSAKKKKGYL